MSGEFTGERSGGQYHQADQSKAEIIDVYGGIVESDKMSVVQFELSDSNIVVTDGQERIFGYEEGFGEFREPTEGELEEFNESKETDYWVRGPEGYIKDDFIADDI